MKKIIITISLILSSYICNAQIRYTYPLEIGIGYSKPTVKDWFGMGNVNSYAMGTYNMIECSLCGLYAAMSTPVSSRTIFDEVQTRKMFRFGIELGRFVWDHYLWARSLSITPFYCFNHYTCGGTTVNSNAWGMKFDFSFSFIDMSLMASKQEITFGINFILPLFGFISCCN